MLDVMYHDVLLASHLAPRMRSVGYCVFGTTRSMLSPWSQRPSLTRSLPARRSISMTYYSGSKSPENPSGGHVRANHFTIEAACDCCPLLDMSRPTAPSICLSIALNSSELRPPSLSLLKLYAVVLSHWASASAPPRPLMKSRIETRAKQAKVSLVSAS